MNRDFMIAISKKLQRIKSRGPVTFSSAEPMNSVVNQREQLFFATQRVIANLRRELEQKKVPLC